MTDRRRWEMKLDRPPFQTNRNNILMALGGFVLLVLIGTIVFVSTRTGESSSFNTACQDTGDAGYKTGGFCPDWKDVGFVQVFVDSYETPIEYYALEEKSVENNKYLYRLVNENKNEAINVDLAPMRKLKSGDKITVSNPSEEVQFNVVLYS